MTGLVNLIDRAAYVALFAISTSLSLVAHAYTKPEDAKSLPVFLCDDNDLTWKAVTGSLDNIKVGYVVSTRTGIRHVLVAKHRWPECWRVLKRQGYSVEHLNDCMDVGTPLDVWVQSELLAEDWEAALDRMLADPARAQSDSAKKVIAECKARLRLAEEGKRIPTKNEWHEMMATLTRREAAEFLLNRLMLTRGELNDCGVPVSTALIDGGIGEKTNIHPALGQNGPVDDAIDPIRELISMQLKGNELLWLVPFFGDNWTILLQQRVVVDSDRVRLFPSTRYSLCRVVNNSVGVANAIRDYQMSDQEWRDANLVSSVLKQIIASTK